MNFYQVLQTIFKGLTFTFLGLITNALLILFLKAILPRYGRFRKIIGPDRPTPVIGYPADESMPIYQPKQVHVGVAAPFLRVDVSATKHHFIPKASFEVSPEVSFSTREYNNRSEVVYFAKKL